MAEQRRTGDRLDTPRQVKRQISWRPSYDTDSFGATAGSYLGALLGPSAFDRDHWLGRFQDRIHLALATFHEQSLSALAQRMSRLPTRA